MSKSRVKTNLLTRYDIKNSKKIMNERLLI